MRRRVLGLALLVSAATAGTVVGCSSSSSSAAGAAGATEAKSEKTRDDAPVVASADATALVAGNDAFAFALYHQLRSENPQSSLVYSPYSISLALSMAYAGAEGETATEMATALDFTLPAATLFPAFDGLDLGITAAASGSAGTGGQPFELKIANSLWVDEALPLVPAFLDTLAVDYGAGVQQVDFRGAPEAAREAINDWVSDATAGKIADLLPEGSIDGNTRAALVNALYFDGAWADPFLAAGTSPEVFVDAAGSAASVNTMHKTGTFAYASVDGVQAVELPYSGGGESMIVLLPDDEHAAGFDAALDTDSYAALVSALTPTAVELQLPKFTITGSTISLATELETLGMRAAFDCAGGADFSGLTSSPLCIDNVYHQAYLAVTEEGTEAAAATAVVFADASVGVSYPTVTPVPMHVDHPFAVVIRDVASGTLLFLGKVDAPGT